MCAEKHASDPTSPAANEATVSPGETRLRVCSFESRRSAEMRSLIERHGAAATVVASMREIPLDRNPDVFKFADVLRSGRVDVVIFMTGVGASALADVWKTRYDLDDFFARLNETCVIVRGPKPAAVLHKWNVRVDHRAPDPNTWRELLAVIDASVPIAGKLVAVQEYGQTNDQLHRALEERGAEVLSVPVYRWSLPEDVEPLKSAIHDTISGAFDVLMFTSANQLTNTLTVAESDGLRDRWLEAARRTVIAAIGPTAAETLQAAGLTPDVVASPPKMGQLVRQTIAVAPGLLKTKRLPA